MSDTTHAEFAANWSIAADADDFSDDSGSDTNTGAVPVRGDD